MRMARHVRARVCTNAHTRSACTPHALKPPAANALSCVCALSETHWTAGREGVGQTGCQAREEQTFGLTQKTLASNVEGWYTDIIVVFEIFLPGSAGLCFGECGQVVCGACRAGPASVCKMKLAGLSAAVLLFRPCLWGAAAPHRRHQTAAAPRQP